MQHLTFTETARQHAVVDDQVIDRYQVVQARAGYFEVVDLTEAVLVEAPADLWPLDRRDAHDLQQEYLYS